MQNPGVTPPPPWRCPWLDIRREKHVFEYVMRIWSIGRWLYRPIQFQERYITLSAMPGGFQKYDKRWVFQTLSIL